MVVAGRGPRAGENAAAALHRATTNRREPRRGCSVSTTEERNDNLDAAEHDTENATEQQTPRRRGRLKRGTQEAFTRKLAHLLDIGAKIEIIGKIGRAHV